MRIAYVVTRADPIGGVQTHVRDLAISLRAQGHEPAVITSGQGPFIDDLRSAGVPVVLLRHLSVPIHPLRDLRALGEIHAALRKLQPDLAALHSSKAGILGRLAGRSLGIPVVLTAHGWSFTPGISTVAAAVYRQIERSVGPITTKIITVSEYDRRLALDARLASEDRVVTVHNGIVDITAQLRSDPSANPPRLVMIARFGAQKDHPTLLQALAGLKDHFWELDLIGKGPLMGEVERLAATLGLRDRVNFLGQRTDVDRILAGAQASILATNWEGFPISILEAMRAGLPVVATAVAGVGEAVSDGETGYLVPRGSVEVLRDRIARLLMDRELRVRLGTSGRTLYEQQFTLERFVRNTLAVYEGVLSGVKRAESHAAEFASRSTG